FPDLAGLLTAAVEALLADCLRESDRHDPSALVLGERDAARIAADQMPAILHVGRRVEESLVRHDPHESASSSVSAVAAAIRRATSRRTAILLFRACTAASERRPCFLPALADRIRPSGVTGPRLFPPCMRQRVRPCTAGARHSEPFRVRAPQRGA